MPSFGSFLPRMKPGLIGFDDERRDALVLQLRLRHREQHDVIGHRAGRDPTLAPVDDVVIAVAHRPALHRARVRSAHRLGQRIRADLLPVAIGVTYFCFCSSVPNFRMPWQYSELFTDMIVLWLTSALAISIIAST